VLRGIGAFVRVMLLVALGAALVAAGANAQPAATPVTVASGLDNPRGLEVGPGGAVYVAEAGSGGGTCFGTGMNRFCLGFTGAVTRIAGGSQQRIATGFLSGAGPDGSFATGPDDVAVTKNGTVYAIETSAPPEAFRGLPAAIRRQAGRLFRLRPGGGWTAVANVGRLEERINPDGREVNPNPYGVVAGPAGVFYVVDAGGNTLLRVDRGGHVSLLAVLPPQTVGRQQVQSVPTTVTVGPDGALYVGELGGEGTPRGRSRIFRIDPFADEEEGEEEIEVFATGFSAISGIDFGPNGALYVSEQFGPGESLTGAVVKVAPNGRRSVLARLPAPGGVAVAPNGAVYVSVNSVFAGIGSVVRLRG
jgi:sugar lactone lactonase YvrE